MLSKVEIRARYDTRYDTGHKYPDLKSRSNDRTENESWTQRSLDTKVELNPASSKITYWRRISSWKISSVFIIYQINLYCLKAGTCLKVVWFVCVRTKPDFQVNISCQITGNEVLILF